MRAGVAVVLLAACLLGGCRKSADVTVTGRIDGVAESDSLFVTLSRDWSRGVVAPISFEYDAEGKFALRFEVSNPPPPLTFVRNGTAIARLEFKDTWSFAPVLVDRIGGKEFPVTVVSEAVLNAKHVNIP